MTFNLTLKLENCCKLEKQVSLPVMIWIHGGSYEVGGSDDFRPDHFMDEDVVLVVMNYRLSSFGNSSGEFS